MWDIIKESFRESAAVKKLCVNKLERKIEIMAKKIISTLESGRKILIFGNGGSAADAQHLAGELVGHFDCDRRSLPAIALTTDTSVISCIANDYSYDQIFARQIEGLGQKGDLALGISTSGNSVNVVQAFKKAQSMGLYTVALTGKKGGECAEISDLLLNVPSNSTPRIQEAHITIIHIVCELLESEMFSEKKGGRRMKKEYLRPPEFDLNQSKTNTAFTRKNLVTIENMADPATSEIPDWEHPEFPELIDRIIAAREKGNPVIWSLGAHVIKCGLSRYLIELMEAGYVSHLAGNGAVSIHDFEISYLGGTSEYVPHAIEDGSFGMWEETGLWLNEALKQGYEKGLGYGASLAEYMNSNPERFPHREDSVVYQAYKRGIPATFHVTIGTDIIDEHPAADFSAKGGTSGRDFAIYCHSISQLEGGVFLNFGSAVTGPEVFLKALAICRNQGYELKEITTANFDLIPLGEDYRKEIGKDDYHYFYRPRKNIINRPTSLGGKGFYIRGNHKNTIPSMYSKLKNRS